ncbi:MAG: arylsulfatase [Sphingobacteriales bacterium]|nr:arylsulfatase [Sphingobacteriales bacterium]
MKRQKIIFLNLYILSVFCFPATTVFAQEAALMPNIVIILADDMGYGDVSGLNIHARTHTPNIDQMIKKGVNFTDAHSGGAVCTPSRYGLITGRYYFRAEKKFDYLGYLKPLIDRNRETIGSLMQKAGYETACVGKWHLGLDWGLKSPDKPQIPLGDDKRSTNTDFTKSVTGGPNALGFDYSYILPASLDMPPYVFIENNRVIDPDIIFTADAYPRTLQSTKPVWDRKYTNADDIYWERGIWWRNGEMSRSFKMEGCFDTIVAKGLSFIAAHVTREPKQPFMLYLSLTGPHTPWLADKVFVGTSPLGSYGDFILEVDDAVQQVNAMLQRLDISDNTMVVFASDNGAGWAEDDIQVYNHKCNAGRRGQKGDIYDGGHHVPLIITWPSKIKKPFTVKSTMSLVDLMATFAEMTSQAISDSSAEDSFSFLRTLLHPSAPLKRKDIIYESSMGRLAIKAGDWKYIDCLGSGGFTDPATLESVKGGPAAQLYNLKSDPLESQNLFEQYPEKANFLKDLLNEYVKQGHSR